MIDQKSLFSISYGLYVLIAREGERDNGCIVNVAQQVADQPLRLMVCVNKQNLTHDMVLRTARFNLCPLSEEATMKPFQHFGFQSGRDVNKFADCQQELRTENGLLYLPRFINAVISGRVVHTVDLGSHTMFIAEVTEARTLTASPSITYAYYQQHIKPTPKSEVGGQSPSDLQPPTSNLPKKWVCEVCGYVYEGDEVPDDFICPWCKHGKSDFKPMV